MALTDLVLMPGEHYQDICNAIREKNGQTQDIVSGDAGELIRAIQTGEEDLLSFIFSSYALGIYTPNTDLSGASAITHNLGVAPNFYCIFAVNSSTVGSGYLISGIGTKTAGSSGYVSYIYNSTTGTLTPARGTFSSSSSSFNLIATSVKYKANVDYYWIVGVTK